jgi:hypothetical protein
LAQLQLQLKQSAVDAAAVVAAAARKSEEQAVRGGRAVDLPELPLAVPRARWTKGPKCQLCRVSFRMLGPRRHHCRGCGKSVCYDCSSGKMELRGVGMQRACSECDPVVLAAAVAAAAAERAAAGGLAVSTPEYSLIREARTERDALARRVMDSGMEYEGRCCLEVVEVFRVEYKAPQKRFTKQVAQLYHGTPRANISGVLRNGFAMPAHAGGLGRAIYFSESAKTAVWYSKPVDGVPTLLLLCEVEVGKVGRLPTPGYDPDITAERVHGQGFNSMTTASRQYPSALMKEETAIYREGAARVTHVIKLNIKFENNAGACTAHMRWSEGGAKPLYSPFEQCEGASDARKVEAVLSRLCDPAVTSLHLEGPSPFPLFDMLQSRSLQLVQLALSYYDGHTQTGTLIPAAAEALRTNCKLEALAISCCWDHDLDSIMFALARGLECNDRLKKLQVGVSMSSFQDGGKTTSLVSIRNSAGKVLAAALQSNGGLQSLYVNAMISGGRRTKLPFESGGRSAILAVCQAKGISTNDDDDFVGKRMETSSLIGDQEGGIAKYDYDLTDMRTHNSDDY